MFRYYIRLIGVLIFLLPGVVLAAGAVTRTGHWPTQEDFPFLPDYCAARFVDRGNPTPRYLHWSRILGASFGETVHHLCAGINAARIASQAHNFPNYPGQEEFFLRQSLLEFQYVIDKASPAVALMPDTYSYQGQSYLRLKDVGKAMTSFKRAIELNPKYLPAYVELTNLYVKMGAGHTKEALFLVTEGLRHNPDSKALKRKYLELGGREPFPEPYVAPSPQMSADSDKTAPSSTPTNDIPPNVTPSQVQAAPSAPAPIPVAAKTEDDRANIAPDPQSTLGTKQNPWCRFCPAQAEEAK